MEGNNTQQPPKNKGPWLRIDHRLVNYRDWRVVWAEDSVGRKCQCLLVPMLQNGIYLSSKGPRQTLMVLKHSTPPADPNDLGYIIPYLHPDAIETMRTTGLITEGDRTSGFWSRAVGILTRPRWTSKQEYEDGGGR